MDPITWSGKHLLFKHPFTCFVAGPTGSGKTELVRDILRYNEQTIYIDITKPLSVLWCYGIYQDRYNNQIENSDTKYIKGMPEMKSLVEKRPDIIVIDDLMTEVGDSENLTSLFTRDSHHMNISVIFLVQNVFHQGKAMRNVSLNSRYMILMKNTRDKRQIMQLGTQIYPRDMNYFMDAYEDATRGEFGYLLIDLKDDTPDEFRLRSSIIPVGGLFEPIAYFKPDVLSK